MQNKKVVAEFNNAPDGKVKMVINSFKKLVSMQMRRRRKSCAARPREGWENVVNKFKRAVNMEITMKNCKETNTALD